MENHGYIRRNIERDFEVHSGVALESLFKAVLIESKQFGRIGGYWDAKGYNIVYQGFSLDNLTDVMDEFL